MLERELTVSNRLGLHARATAKLVQTLAPFRCNVTMAAKGREINAKSIMGVMLLAAGQGTPGHHPHQRRRRSRRDGRGGRPVRAPLRRGQLSVPRAAPTGPRTGQRPVQLLAGHGAARGTALGRARVRLPHALEVAEQRVAPSQVEAELARLHRAVDAARTEMLELRQRLHGALNQEVGEFLDLHALLLDDPELLFGLDELIRSGPYSAGYALRLQRDRLGKVFDGMDDAYLKSRMDDLDHVIGRIHAFLQPSGRQAVKGWPAKSWSATTSPLRAGPAAGRTVWSAS